MAATQSPTEEGWPGEIIKTGWEPLQWSDRGRLDDRGGGRKEEKDGSKKHGGSE